MEGVTATNGKEKVMFEHKTEEEARKEILSMVEGYYQTFHAKKEDFREGDRISYAARVYDQDEMCNLVDSALEFWLTSGRYTEQFEKELADYIGVRFCSLVNSGSSANLLAFMALTSPLLGLSYLSLDRAAATRGSTFRWGCRNHYRREDSVLCHNGRSAGR